MIRTITLSTLFLFPTIEMMAVEGTFYNDSIHKIKEVVVTGARTAIDPRYLSQTVTVVDNKTLNENYRQNVLPTLMEQVPGLMLTSRGMMGYGVSTGAAGGLMMRGISSGSGQMMVLIDGHPQYNGIFGHSIADSYQTMMAERVEVLRGPSSMLYGSNAMGGVINIVTSSANGSRLNAQGAGKSSMSSAINVGGGSYGTAQAEGYNMFRYGRFTSTVAMQYGRSDNHRYRMGFEQYGGYVKLGYDISKHWNVFADADITHFTSSYPGTETAPKYDNDQWITRYALNFVLENSYSELHTANGTPVTTSGALSIYDNFGRHKIDDGYDEGKSPQVDYFRSKDAVAGVSLYQNVTYRWRNPTTLTFGFDWQHIYGEAWYENKETGAVMTIKKRMMQSCDSHENDLAGYVALSQDIAHIATLNAGLRIDYHTVAGTEFVPQVGLTIRPLTTAELKLSVSKGFRNPTTKEMFLYGTANSDSLRAERLWNYEIAWSQYLLDGSIHYGINVFYINADNIIQTVKNHNVNTGTLRNYGVELEVTWRIDSHWSVNTNHSYLHMEKAVVSAPTYKGYIGGSWQYEKWAACLGVTHVSGLYTATGINEQKEHFTLVNATVSYQLLRFLRLWAKGDNLLAQRYETIAGMPMPRATFMGGVQLNF